MASAVVCFCPQEWQLQSDKDVKALLYVHTYSIFFLHFSQSFKKSWGFGTEKTTKEKAAYNVLKEEMKKLGPVSYAELNVFILFVLLVVLWFSRNPGFVKGWASRLFPGGEK